MYYIKLNNQFSVKKYKRKGQAEQMAQIYRRTLQGVEVEVVDEKKVRKRKE